MTDLTSAPTSTAALPSPSLGSTAPTSGRDGVEVLGADHLVLRTADTEAALDFYVGKLGLVPERLEQWRAGTVPFPSVRVSETFVIDLDARRGSDGTNVEHFCLEVAPTSLQAIFDSGEFSTVGDPVRRWGARGPADMIYVRDPDGNTIELRHYGPTEGFEYGARS